MKAMLITKFRECVISSLEMKDIVINLYFSFDFCILVLLPDSDQEAYFTQG